MDKTTPIGIPAWRPLQPEETAHGLLLRLTELIGYRSPDWTARCMGIRRSDLARGRVDALRVFANTIMAEIPQLTCDSPIPNGKGKMSVRGIPVTKFMYSIDSRRACPKCLADSAHHRFWWDMLPITTCPRHQLKLVDRCSCDDDAVLGWRIAGLKSCPCCRKPLAQTLPKISADPSVVRVDTYLLSRFGAGMAEPLPVLDAMSVLDALDTMERVGAAAISGYQKLWQDSDTVDTPPPLCARVDFKCSPTMAFKICLTTYWLASDKRAL